VKAKRRKPKYRYRILTWDVDKQNWTREVRVRAGPWTLSGLKRASRQVRALGGYEGLRDTSVMVDCERIK
jgi:hypothetical protein